MYLILVSDLSKYLFVNYKWAYYANDTASSNISHYSKYFAYITKISGLISL